MEIKLSETEKEENFNDIQKYLLILPFICFITGLFFFYDNPSILFFGTPILSTISIVYSIILRIMKIGKQHFKYIFISLLEIVLIIVFGGILYIYLASVGYGM